MTATRIPDAFLVTCGCQPTHGWHLVCRINGKWYCDGTCPAFVKAGACAHIDEAWSVMEVRR